MGLFSSYLVLVRHAWFQYKVRSAAASQLHKLVLSPEEFSLLHWVEEEKEFDLNGKLYDVSGIERQPNQIIIRYSEDAFETLLTEIWSSLTDQNGTPLPDPGKKIDMDKYVPALPCQVSQRNAIDLHPYFELTTPFIALRSKEVESPPPEVPSLI